MPQPTLLEYALQYARMGIRVFPLAKHGKLPAIPKTAPYNGKGVHDATTDENIIRRWWTRYPQANIGLACGKPFIAIDLDTDNPEIPIPILPGCAVQETWSGGKHILYAPPEERTLNKVGFIEGVDCRTDGGYIVAAPSVIKEGDNEGVYTWKIPLSIDDLPVLPDHILAYVAEKNKFEETVPEGKRDDRLTQRIGRLFGSGLHINEVMPIALSLNQTVCNPPLPAHQVEKIVRSIADREARKQKKSKSFPLYTTAMMFEKYATEPAKFSIDEWMPEASCGLIISPPGRFKTWLMLDASRAVSTGTNFLGMYKVNNPGPVIIIQQEDSYVSLVERLASVMNLGKPKFEGDELTVSMMDMPNIYWYTERDFTFHDPEILAAFEKRLLDLKPRLVIFDPLYSVGETEDYFAKTAKKMLICKKWRDKIGTSFYAVHHTHRTPPKDGRERDKLWGSQFLNAWLEVGWQISEHSDADAFVYRNFKSAKPVEPVALNFEIDDGMFAVTRPGDDPTNYRLLLANLLVTENIGSLDQIRERLGIKSKSTVERLLKSINAEKVNGIYRISSVVDDT